MHNIETREFDADVVKLVDLLNKARAEERTEQAFKFARRLKALANEVQRDRSGSRFYVADLLREEAQRHENEAHEVRANG
ncbi:hypothetical protein WB91_17230 [bacteria symbiont BFo1 of Frankliniella occidentalis]|nr:hypothetical protein WB91_17230 [bacteria symbiont BFo1 of Frankliniella occidentalis]